MRRLRRALRVVVVLVGIGCLFVGALTAFRVHIAMADPRELRDELGIADGDSLYDQDDSNGSFLAVILAPVPIEGRCGRPIAGAFRDDIALADLRLDGATFREESLQRYLADLSDLGVDDVEAPVRAAVARACRDAARLRLAIAGGLLVIGLETVYLGVARPSLRREPAAEPSPPLPSPEPSSPA